ncbi:hypothetical protein [Jeongeupia chitinilytica]|uniref:Lipoyl-binding domain-containing protein n=1 Tax=Jeongeupia chitinilytica TaxID=1041641 RepID=A0ABQ3H340_9NEIS|nr:hypothetical protein [Jeongeupia chitinilytica]GHD65076.1 hypothetical protein GCM10007350_25240 [Jeongeupia chitinilytica]
MAAETTTHLICAPDFDGIATVTALHHPVGARIATDAALLTLTLGNGGIRQVHAPEAGTLGSFTVTLGDAVHAGELVALMDIEEAPTGWLFSPDESAGNAHSGTDDAAGGIDPSRWLSVSVDAARLAHRLGVDLSELPAAGRIDVADVEHYVREKLAQPR